MQRRDFLKYLMSASAICCTSCKEITFQNEQEIKEKNNDKYIRVIKLPICYHCNLNCAYCNHFAPIAPKYEVPVEQFEKDIKQLQKITKGKIRNLALLGGGTLVA